MTDRIFDVPRFEDLVEPVDPLTELPRASFGSQIAATLAETTESQSLTAMISARMAEFFWEHRQQVKTYRLGQESASILESTIGKTYVLASSIGSLEPLDAFEDALDREFQELPTESYGSEFPAPSARTRTFSRRIVRDIAHAMFESTGQIIPVPSLDAVTDGGIDVHWKTARAELLINMPADDDPSTISFYGYTPDRSDIVKGTLSGVERNHFLMVWFMSR